MDISRSTDKVLCTKTGAIGVVSLVSYRKASASRTYSLAAANKKYRSDGALYTDATRRSRYTM